MMKNRRSSAKKVEHKILGEEADKLKDKLDTLKEQIRLKKQQKQMNKTSTSVYSMHSNNRPASRQLKSQTQSSFNQQAALHQMLIELKIQSIEGKLKEKNIQSLGQLRQVRVEDVDQWKDIPVGYRIKIKKYIEKAHNNENTSESKQQKSQSSRPKTEQILNIESIIESRKQQNKFVPMTRAKDIDSEDEKQQELEQQQQEKMMLSIMQAFGGRQRTSSFKKKQKKAGKSVHWSPSVDEMQKNSHHDKQYPKQRINKSIFDIARQQIKEQMPMRVTQKTEKKDIAYNTQNNTDSQFPDYKYCWICLKKINEVFYTQENRQFCSKKCFSAYQETVNYELIEAADKYIEEPLQEKTPQEVEDDAFELSFDIV